MIKLDLETSEARGLIVQVTIATQPTSNLTCCLRSFFLIIYLLMLLIYLHACTSGTFILIIHKDIKIFILCILSLLDNKTLGSNSPHCLEDWSRFVQV